MQREHDALILHIMPSWCIVYPGKEVKMILSHGQYYICGLHRHCAPGCVIRNPVFAACFCTAIDFDASNVLSAVASDEPSTSRMSMYLFHAGMLLSNTALSLCSARTSCIKHLMTKVQFMGLLNKLKCDKHLRLCIVCTAMRQRLCFLDDTVIQDMSDATLIVHDLLLHIWSLSHSVLQSSYAKSACVVSMHRFSEGGGVQYIDYNTLLGYIQAGHSDAVMQNTNRYVYVDYLIKYDNDHVLPPVPANHIHLQVPLSVICSKIPVKELQAITKMHVFEDVNILYMNKASLVKLYSLHDCYRCQSPFTILKVCPLLWKKPTPTKILADEVKRSEVEAVQPDEVPFPPVPLDDNLSHSIITDFCSALSPSRFEESGCCVCGQLTPMDQLSKVKHMKRYMSVLENPDVTRMECEMTDSPVCSVDGPVIDETLQYICIQCRASVRDGKVPAKSLANGLWLGAVPEVLSKLTFVEQLLVSKVRHNCCFVKVSLASVGHPGLGSCKMISHIISFDAPVTKIYNMLPPPRRDMDDVLAVLFTGPERPTEDDMKRTPLLVRQQVVLDALEWLLLNHHDYSDVCISQENMLEYADNSAPVEVMYHHSNTDKVSEGTSVFDMEKSDGTSVGVCPVVVHGLVGEQLTAMKLNAQKMHATWHFKANRGVLAIGHVEMLESIYNNPSLYPSMFPWLFPYGMGGIGTTGMSDAEHKKWLLMYHNKHFQTDNFPFVAFSHKQIKASTTGGYLLMKKDQFHNISECIFWLDEAMLTSISERMKEGIKVVPSIKEEKDCFQIINIKEVYA